MRTKTEIGNVSLYLFWSLLKIPLFFSFTGNCKQKIWLKQLKAAPALDFPYFQHVSKLVTHDRKVLKSQDFRTFFALFCPITCLLFFLTQTLTPTGRGAESIRPHGRGYCPLFLPLHAWPRSLHERRRKRVTHSAFGEKSHTAAYTAKQGLFRMGVVSLPSECSACC